MGRGNDTAARRNQAVGNYGERHAARHLEGLGWRIVDRNWRCREGEVDIVALDGACLVVCEVKTRRSEAFGSTIEAVTPRKAARLRRLAGCWVQAHPGVVAGSTDLRVDVIGVLLPTRGSAEVTHVVGVGA